MKLLKNRMFVSLLSVGVAVVVIVASVLSIMLPSFFSWQDYYNKALEDKEYQKYIQSLPLELLGLSATLSDSVTYYDNGKAKPKNDDFIVTANFSEKGREFDKILSSNLFDMDAPADFAAKGGTVKISYAFTPPTEDEEGDGSEAPEPIVKTADVECSLEKVVPAAINITQMPYRIVYHNEMSFDVAGLEAVLTFNDGSKEIVGVNELSASSGLLSVGTEQVDVIWKRGGTELPFKVPVTVKSKAEYSDGHIIAIKPEGKAYIAEGALTADAKPVIRATYENGNRLILAEDQYTVRGNTETASFIKKCLLTIMLNNDPAIFSRVSATVRSGIEAEAATLSASANTAEVTEYEFNGNEYVPVSGNTTVVVPQNGSTVSFNVSISAVSKPDMIMRVALKPNAQIGGGLNLSSVMGMTVNGRRVVIPESTVLSLKKGAEDKYVFEDVVIPSPVLNNSQNNSIVFSFSGSAAANLAIDRISLEAGYVGEFYVSTVDYIVHHTAEGTVNPPFNYEVVKPWGRVADKPYPHGVCSDGTYLYVIATGYSASLRSVRVEKYNPTTNETVAISAETEAAITEPWAGISYYDEKIIIFYNDGRRMYVDANNFVNGCVFQQYYGFDFEGLETAPIKDVYYNSSKQMFAVFSSNSIYLFDKDKKLVNGFSNVSEGASSMRLIGDADYVFVNHTKNGQVSPLVHVYDWNGTHIGRLVVPVTLDFLVSTGGGYIRASDSNIQGLTVVNGDFYVIILKWGANGSEVGMCFKIKMPEISDELEPELTLSEYLNACEDASVTPEFTASPTTGEVGEIDTPGDYAMGGVSDGKYIYASVINTDKTQATVVKIDADTNAVVAQSIAFGLASTITSSDPAKMFIKDGVLYLIAGEVYSIALDSFKDLCVLTKDNAMTDLLSANGTRIIHAAYYNAVDNKYALIDTSNTMFILNEDGDVLDSQTVTKAGYATSSVCGDENYIYVSYRADNQSQLPIEVYEWDGTLVTTLNVTGITLEAGVDYNVQTIYMHNNVLHASIDAWTSDSAYFYDWTISWDLSILF